MSGSALGLAPRWRPRTRRRRRPRSLARRPSSVWSTAAPVLPRPPPRRTSDTSCAVSATPCCSSTPTARPASRSSGVSTRFSSPSVAGRSGPCCSASCPLREAILRTDDGAAILPASHLLDDVALPDLIRARAGFRLLRETLGVLRGQYEFIVIDGPQNLSLIADNVIAASDMLIVPYSTARGTEDPRELELVLERCDRVRANGVDDLRLACVLPTRFKRRSSTHQRRLHQLRQFAPEGVEVLTPIDHSNWFEIARLQRRAIFEVNSTLPAAEAYRDLAQRIASVDSAD